MTDTVSWYKFSPLSDNPCQTRTSQETEKNLRKFPENVAEAKCYSYVHYYNLASIVKNYHGVIEQLHLIAQKQAEVQNEPYVEQRKRHQPYQGNLDRMNKWWLDSMQCYCCLRDDQDFLADGKSQNERRCWRILLRHALFACESWEEYILTAKIEELKSWMHQKIFTKRLNAKEVLRTTPKDRELVFLVADGSAKISVRDCEFQEPTLRRESTVKRKNLSGEPQGDSNLKKQKMTTGSTRTLGLFKGISFIVIILNREVQLSCREKNHSLFPRFTQLNEHPPRRNSRSGEDWRKAKTSW